LPQMNETELRGIVESVVRKMLGGAPPASASEPPKASSYSPRPRGVYETVDAAVQAAREAFRVLNSMTLEQRAKIISAIRACGIKNAREFAERTIKETGMGRLQDKLNKMFSSAERTPGIEDIATAAWSGDSGLTTEEMAPWGVIAAVTPSTHPVPTLINNAISMVAAGNAVVFAPHPASKNVFLYAIGLMNDAITEAGGPENILVTTAEPTIESAAELFKHPGAPLLTVTGGPGVVKAAMQSTKKVIAAGPGNPPVVVDETADIQQAVADIIEGAGFDNNILCVAEKEIFVVDSVFDIFMREMALQGQVKLERPQIEILAKESFVPSKGGHFVLNRELVGRCACVLAERIGMKLTEETRLLFGEVEHDHIFVMEEQMMPFLPIVRVPDVRRGIELAIMAEGARFHTALMHSRNIASMHEMARRVNTTIFIKNGSCLAGLGVGGEGTLSFTIATPTGEGVTTARTFTRRRRCALKRYFHIV